MQLASLALIRHQLQVSPRTNLHASLVVRHFGECPMIHRRSLENGIEIYLALDQGWSIERTGSCVAQLKIQVGLGFWMNEGVLLS